MKEKPIFQKGRRERMAQSKYETHVLPNLDKIIKWAKAGATAKEIAGKLHVAYSTFKQIPGPEGRKGDGRYTDTFRLLSRRRARCRTSRWRPPCSSAACGFEYPIVKHHKLGTQKLDRKLGNVRASWSTTINKVRDPVRVAANTAAKCSG